VNQLIANQLYKTLTTNIPFTSAGYTSECYAGRKQSFPAGSFVSATWLKDKKMTVLNLISHTGKLINRYAQEPAPEIRKRVRKVLGGL